MHGTVALAHLITHSLNVSSYTTEVCFCWSAVLLRPSLLLFETEARRRCAGTRVSRTTLDATATGVSAPDDVWIISDVVLRAQPQSFYLFIFH